MENPEKPTLKVTDRRHFTREGKRRADLAPEEANAPPAAGSSQTQERVQVEGQAEPLSVVFQRLVISLAKQALMMLGEQPDPISGQREPHLEEAQEIIDMLMSLRLKTRGNLTPEEDTLLSQIVYELQMKYSEKTRP